MPLTEIKYDIQLIESINKMIKEEMGVNSRVINSSFEIYSLIEKSFQEAKSIVVDDGVGQRNGNVKYDFEGKILDIQYFILNFRDRKYMEKYAEAKGINNDAKSIVLYNKRKNENKYVLNGIWLYGVSISGTIQKSELLDGIQHELEHVYQQFKMGNDFGKEDVIGYVNDGLKSSDPFEFNVANLVYMSFKYEQEGFANGLYAYCASDPTHYNDRFLSSPAYKKLLQLKEGRKFLEENISDEHLAKVLEKYKVLGITQENILRKLDKTINECIRRFGRVFCKVMKDINSKMRDGKIDRLL